MWAAVKRVLKPRGAFVTTASQPFTSALVMSNTAWFKYCWVWEKTKPQNFLNSHNAPMKITEDVVVFSGGTIANCSDDLMRYNPQGLQRCYILKTSVDRREDSTIGYRPSRDHARVQTMKGYPPNLIRFASDATNEHPTQKPVALYAYLVRTYTNEGDMVLDMCCGSGTTIVAAIQEGRNGIGIEKDAEYCRIAERRCTEAAMQGRLL
jgi:site-specific DNA-methyltransferase (adenine-specific)